MLAVRPRRSVLYMPGSNARALEKARTLPADGLILDLEDAVAPAVPCACGRTAPKLAGLLGRVGDAVKVRGMFVRGAQVEAVAKRFPEVARVQAVVTREAHQDRLEVVAEVAAPGSAGDLAARLAEALREEIKVRPEVRLVAAGTIPAAAKRIEDRRVWK